MDIDTNPYMSVQERNAAIEEYITIREAGESLEIAGLMHNHQRNWARKHNNKDKMKISQLK